MDLIEIMVMVDCFILADDIFDMIEEAGKEIGATSIQMLDALTLIQPPKKKKKGKRKD